MTTISAAVAIQADPAAFLDIFSEFATDSTLETAGTWMPYKTGELLIARANNRAFSKALTEHIEANRAMLDAKDANADKKSDEIMIDVTARHLLKGWKNIGYKGQLIEYSVENAKLLLAHPDFRKKVNELSDQREAFRIKEIEETSKN